MEAVLAGRFFVGLSLGMEGSIHSMYICEIVSKRYRGPMVASGVVVINFGFLLVYILGSFTNWQVRVGSVNIDFFMAFYGSCLLLNVHFAISNVFFRPPR